MPPHTSGAGSLRSRVVAAYRKLVYISHDYPGDGVRLRRFVHDEFMRRAHLRDRDDILLALRDAHALYRDIESVIQIRKYRFMRYAQHHQPSGTSILSSESTSTSSLSDSTSSTSSQTAISDAVAEAARAQAHVNALLSEHQRNPSTMSSSQPPKDTSKPLGNTNNPRTPP